ncbi:alpha/beta hydrolase-fold protein [Gramella sp. MAR_2010_147]|uniref:alpha/beta hydrolase n=1 Tax=Gramella sp. MAR_2010_147 TaxID=1250205 RepID=UPI00087B9BDC|nr:alpha/beta hydrolase-fold protein [Gramella sp. MAR_2010_147]SDR67107.1 Predicted hydrolase of the alpha/beta superfamily [Gramella sp. MAR_2010_147]
MRSNPFLLILILFISFNSLAQSSLSKQVKHFTIETPQLDTIKKIWIYLPGNYRNTERKYPVIYMHDGQNLFDKETSYVGEWEVDEILDSIKTPEAIIVGIEHGGNKRIDELTPFPHEKYGGGKADVYLNFILNNLKPHIDSTYRTLPDHENTGIFGSSLGGLVAYYAALKYPNTFGMVGAYSPSFWFNDKIYDMTRESNLNTKTKFYFLVGTEESEEMVPDLKRMIEVLKEKGIKNEKFKVKYVEGGKHNEVMWSDNFLESYLWLMRN